MTDILVSVRMPASLATKLEQSSVEDDFLDVSEHIRSILRDKWLQSTQPEVYELRTLRKQIEQDVKNVTAQRVSAQVTEELKKIQSKIRGELLEQ